MTEYPCISWADLPGNKFTKTIDTAMLSEEGYVKLQRIRKKGDDECTIVNVVYDKGYLLETLSRKVIRPLFGLGKDEVVKIVEESWDYFENESVASI